MSGVDGPAILDKFEQIARTYCALICTLELGWMRHCDEPGFTFERLGKT